MVEFLLGKREQISYAEETTYGTFTTPTDVLGREARFEPNDKQNFQEIRASGSDSINVASYEEGPLSYGGNLIFSPQNWKWLKFVVCNGSSDVTDNDMGSYYQHTFTNNKTIASFSLERAMQHSSTDHVLRYAGCQVNTASISWDASGGEGRGLIDVTLELMAKSKSAGSTVTSLSAPTDKAFQFRHALLTLNSTEIVELVGGTLNIENNLHDARYANYSLNRYKGESQPQIRRFNGTFRIKIKDNTYESLWSAGTAISGTNTLVFRRATNDDVTFTFSNIKIETAPDPTNLDGINEVTLNWNAEDISIVAKDNITSY